MAITREKKKEIVAGYVDRMSNSQALILTDYRGLTVANMMDLRRRMREVDGQFQVVKNTLFALALQRAEIPVPAEQLDGPVAIGYCVDEVPPVAKALVDFAKESGGILEIKGAILGTEFLDTASVQALADLPPREILLAQLLGSVQGPASSLVSTINAPMRELIQVLQARSIDSEHHRLSLHEISVEVNRADDGFQRVRQNRSAPIAAAFKLATAQLEVISKLEFTGHAGQRRFLHQAGAKAAQIAFAGAGESLVDVA